MKTFDEKLNSRSDLTGCAHFSVLDLDLGPDLDPDLDPDLGPDLGQISARHVLGYTNRASTEAIARRTCERSQRLRIDGQSAASAALPASKKREADRESSVS